VAAAEPGLLLGALQRSRVGAHGSTLLKQNIIMINRKVDHNKIPAKSHVISSRERQGQALP
jgi:hypothetical protein